MVIKLFLKGVRSVNRNIEINNVLKNTKYDNSKIILYKRRNNNPFIKVGCSINEVVSADLYTRSADNTPSSYVLYDRCNFKDRFYKGYGYRTIDDSRTLPMFFKER